MSSDCTITLGSYMHTINCCTRRVGITRVKSLLTIHLPVRKSTVYNIIMPFQILYSLCIYTSEQAVQTYLLNEDLIDYYMTPTVPRKELSIN